LVRAPKGGDPRRQFAYPTERRIRAGNVRGRVCDDRPGNHSVDVVKLDFPAHPRAGCFPELLPLLVDAKELPVLPLAHVEGAPGTIGLDPVPLLVAAGLTSSRVECAA